MSLVAVADDKIFGCVWVRVMDDYGHISDDYPSLSIAVLEEYQQHGIGRALMEAMIEELDRLEYKGVSLSVQTENHAAQ